MPSPSHPESAPTPARPPAEAAQEPTVDPFVPIGVGLLFLCIIGAGVLAAG